MTDRYQRHQGLFGAEGFARIRRGCVLVAGAGGLGSTVLQLLARCGVGTIHVCDHAVIDAPDLNRQILYHTGNLGQRKVAVAVAALADINPDVRVVPHDATLSSETVPVEVDVVIDCLDTYRVRYLLEDLFFQRGIPIVHGGVSGFFGQVTTLLPGKTLGYRGLFGETPPDDPSPSIPLEIFPPVVTMVASLQASETLKLLTGETEHLLLNRIQVIDLLTGNVAPPTPLPGPA